MFGSFKLTAPSFLGEVLKMMAREAFQSRSAMVGSKNLEKQDSSDGRRLWVWVQVLSTDERPEPQAESIETQPPYRDISFEG